MTEEKKEITSLETTLAETAPETVDAVAEETPEKEAVSNDETKASSEVADETKVSSEVSDETKASSEDSVSGEPAAPSTDAGEGEKPAPSRNDDGPRHGYDDDRRRDSRPRGGGYGGRRGDRPLSNEDKVKIYKKQSEERLLDIKRSREDKVGKKRKR